MVSPFLIISVVIVAPLLLFMCFMLLGYFIHEDDKSEAYFPKVVTVCVKGCSVVVVVVLCPPPFCASQ